jgi:dihydroneopterin aldolase
MTRFLVSVVSAHEAAIACAGGADVVDVCAPAPAGTIDLGRLRAILSEIGGRCRTSVTLAGGRLSAEALARLAATATDTGVDLLRIELGPHEEAVSRAAAVAPLADRVGLIAVLHADRDPEAFDLQALVAHRFAGVMLDMAGPGRLLALRDLSALGRFAAQAAAARLPVGFAGALEAPDVERLLLLAPDMLGFRAALTRAGEMNPARVEMIRALIPLESAPGAAKMATRAGGLRAGGGEPTDRVFVHDLVLPVSIGAYDRERDGPQRVRFTVDADVRRATKGAHDMRDVFSYDLITDAIRLILDRGHVMFVEMLAEEIAQAVLAHPRVLKVRVRVEKLDLGAGGVGVEISRDRASEAATVHRLFAGSAGATLP